MQKYAHMPTLREYACNPYQFPNQIYVYLRKLHSSCNKNSVSVQDKTASIIIVKVTNIV